LISHTETATTLVAAGACRAVVTAKRVATVVASGITACVIGAGIAVVARQLEPRLADAVFAAIDQGTCIPILAVRLIVFKITTEGLIAEVIGADVAILTVHCLTRTGAVGTLVA
jgi:hypothetical protein